MNPGPGCLLPRVEGEVAYRSNGSNLDLSYRSRAFPKSFVQMTASKRCFRGFWARYLHERLVRRR